MTRINLIPVKELSDQHLIAEYRELPRVIKQKIDISNAPEKYCLGKGHVKWAKKHTMFILYRYGEICNEMKHRGFKFNYEWSTLAYYAMQQFGPEIFTTYDVTNKDIKLSRSRIIEKIKQKPDWYRWTNRPRPDYAK